MVSSRSSPDLDPFYDILNLADAADSIPQNIASDAPESPHFL
jgi:hypothetical protein